MAVQGVVQAVESRNREAVLEGETAYPGIGEGALQGAVLDHVWIAGIERVKLDVAGSGWHEDA